MNCKLITSRLTELLPQMLGAFEFSLLKFDVGYPTGEKHKSFGTFALQSVGLPNLLAAEVNQLTDRLHMRNIFLGEDQGLWGQGQPGRGWEVSGAQICIEHDIEHVEHWDSTPFTSTLAGLVWAKRRLGCPRLCCSRGWKVGGWRRWPGGTFNTQDLKADHESKMNVRYGGDYTMASLRLFLASKAGLSITMEGCIKWGNNLSKHPRFKINKQQMNVKTFSLTAIKTKSFQTRDDSMLLYSNWTLSLT